MTGEMGDFSHVTELVESLYRYRNDPTVIRETQFHLQKLQLAPNGFQLADELLATDSPNCQFFGALTYMVKINSLSDSNDPGQTLSRLLHWLVVLRGRTKTFVIQKLLSTLSVYFSKFAETWPNALQTVIGCLVTNEPPGHEQDVSQLLLLAKSEDIELALKFSQTLIEDLSNESQTNVRAAKINHILREQNLSAYCQLLAFTYENHNNASSTLIIQAISSYVLWVQYFCGSRAAIDSERHLQKYSEYLLLFLHSNDEEVIEKTIDCIIDITNFVASFWTRSFQDGLCQILIAFGATMHLKYPDMDDDDEEAEKVQLFIKLLVSYCTEYMDAYLGSHGTDKNYEQTLHNLLTFTRGKKNQTLNDDLMSVEILMFWSSFAEEVVGEGYMTSSHQGTIRDYMGQITAIYWERIKLPSKEEALKWNSESWDHFASFRRDFCDFLETVYPLVGLQLFELLVNSVLNAMSATDDAASLDWNTIECSLYCLNGLSAIISPNGDEYSKVRTVFSSSLWKDLSACDNLRVRQTAVNLIGSFDTFFERPEGRPYTSLAMEYLFNSLYIDSLMLIASRSIQKLCISCGKYILDLLPSFFDIYESMSLYSQLENTAHERTVSALAHVIQQLPSAQRQAAYVDRLTSVLIQQAKIAFDNGVQAVNTGSALDAAVLPRTASLLKCLVYLGKGLRRTDEEQENATPQELEEAHHVWQQDECKIRQRILELIKAFSIDHEPFSEDTQICEICCDIFKCGFSEKWSNPFVFDVGTVLTFITAKHQMGPPSCFSALSDLACCLITSEQHSEFSSDAVGQHVGILLNTFFEPSAVALDLEPDVQSANLKLLTHTISHDLFGVFLSRPNIESMIEFLLRVFASSDRLILREASTFWCSYLTRSPSHNQDMIERKEAIFRSVGPALTQIITKKIAGDASRSDLDLYVNVIRRMLAKYSLEAKPWFVETFIEHPQPPLSQKDARFRAQFVQQLLMLRGSKDTGRVVKDFWLACRGITNYAG